MKNHISVNKKIIIGSNDKKQQYLQNPYNDLPTNPVIVPKAGGNKMSKIVDKNIEVSKSPNLKNFKILSPDVPRTVGVSSGSNNDSTHKLKMSADDSKKNKKVTKI